ncbi:uncharacterized protein LOC122251411 [Penaeus japonicus]|uniref:uncharacterized protein LOC122251411 n=1 Tax=Penaeus japonicus TaxID=27405 RepID=UPI001C70B168|nr:uncharacterized protein LOC122251411 [Penaeus japonicus]
MKTLGTKSSLTVTAFLLCIIGLSHAVTIDDVAIPEYKVRGSSARLTCNYSLGDFTLYSLKWYKGDKQFYQYIPGNKKTKNTFLVPGVNVDVDSSDAVTVVLRDVELVTSGKYRCEVITEGPLFHTKIGEGNMTVIDLPDSTPVLEGVKTSYQLRERVHVNCTSPYSKPAATLEWHVNDELVKKPSWLRRYQAQQEPDGLETAVLGLTFVTKRSHFPGGELRLKCVAKIATIYFQSQETSVIETGFLKHTQAEERRHKDHSFFFGSSAPRTTNSCFSWALTAVVVLLNTGFRVDLVQSLL